MLDAHGVRHDLVRAVAKVCLNLAEQMTDLTHTPAAPPMPLALQRLTLGMRSRAAQAGRKASS